MTASGPERPVRRGCTLVPAQGYLPQIVLVQINIQAHLAAAPAGTKGAHSLGRGRPHVFLRSLRSTTIASIRLRSLNGRGAASILPVFVGLWER